MDAPVTRHDRDDVAILEMCHGKANALDIELCEALIRRFKELSGPDAPRAAILTGAGRIFSAGVDLRQVVDGGAGYVRAFVPLLRQTVETLLRVERPVIAALNGHAIAGGCVLACATDRRIVAAVPARMGVPELRVGVPFPTAALEAVALVVPARHLNEVLYEGHTWEAEDAARFGLIDEIVPAEALLDRAVAAARMLAASPPAAFAITKRQLRAGALARIAAARDTIEPDIDALWEQPETMDRVRAYVLATLVRR